jgi:hypothetical protein
MKIALMQPYLFPYLGYFQLINAVDRFILYDNVAFNKQGWINRNFLSAPSGQQRFTLPVCRPRFGRPISQMRLHQPIIHQRRLLNTLRSLYGRAPQFNKVWPVLEAAINYPNADLVGYIHRSLEIVNGYLGIMTPLVSSSSRYPNLRSKGQACVIEICQAEGADIYINAEGGMLLYDGSSFRQHRIDLRFLIHEPRSYKQNCSDFIPRLSIIDVMMFNSRKDIARLLRDYHLSCADKEM